MDIDLDKLKAAALSARQGAENWWLPLKPNESFDGDLTSASDEDYALIAAASPAVVVELIRLLREARVRAAGYQTCDPELIKVFSKQPDMAEYGLLIRRSMIFGDVKHSECGGVFKFLLREADDPQELVKHRAAEIFGPVLKNIEDRGLSLADLSSKKLEMEALAKMAHRSWPYPSPMTLFLKSTTDDGDSKMPLHDKLVLIFKERVKEAEDDEERARAKRDLAKLQAGAE